MCPAFDRFCPALTGVCTSLRSQPEKKHQVVRYSTSSVRYSTGFVRSRNPSNLAGGGFDSRRLHHSATYGTGQNPDKSGQNRDYLGHTPEVASEPPAPNGTLPDQNRTPDGQKKCQTSVKRIPPDLAELEDLWPTIPEEVRASLLSLARAAVAGKTGADGD